MHVNEVKAARNISVGVIELELIAVVNVDAQIAKTDPFYFIIQMISIFFIYLKDRKYY